MSRAARALAASLCLACAPAPAARAPADAILLVGANAFAAGDRAVVLLQDAADATDVLGPARFELLAAPGGRPSDLSRLLRERLARARDVRAVVAVLGDLTLLDGVDPARAPREGRALTSRVPRTAELLDAARALRAQAEAAGAVVLLATAPLSRQARIEVPEILPAAEALRATGPLLDLQAAFASREDEALFAGGADHLDDWGHDRLARELLAGLLAALPPRDAGEHAARQAARALAAFSAGDEPAFRALLPEVEAAPPGPPRAAARRAALLSAAHGCEARAADWDAIAPPPGADVPGLAVARQLLGRPVGDLVTSDPVEQGVVAVLQALAAGSADAAELASARVDLAPQRLEPWLLLQLATTLAGLPRDWRRPALRTLTLFEPAAASEPAAARLLTDPRAALDALPALLCAARATAAHRPDGPLLDTARRRAALGFTENAVQLLQSLDRSQRLPSEWRELIDAWR